MKYYLTLKVDGILSLDCNIYKKRLNTIEVLIIFMSTIKEILKIDAHLI